MIVRELIAVFGFKVDRKSERGLMSRLSGIKKFIGVMGAAFATGVVARGFVKMVQGASDAEETVNKLRVTFQELSQEMEDFANETAAAIGQSRNDVKRFAADFGSLLVPLLGSREAAAGMSKELTKMVFDIASLENLRPQEAFEKLRAGIIGSSEPMLSLGVDTREAALAQFALEQGIGKSTKEMSAATKTALRFDLMLARLTEKGAIGDAVRTANEYANAQRGMMAALSDLSDEIGKVFLPGATETVVMIRDFARSMEGDLVLAAKRLLGVLTELGRAFVLIVRGVLWINDAIVEMADKYLGLNKGLTQTLIIIGALAVALGWPIVLIGLLAAGIFLVIDDLHTMGEGGESVIGTLIQGFWDLVDQLGSVGEAIAAMFITAFSYWTGISEKEVYEFIESLQDGFTMFGKWLEHLWTSLVEFMANEFIGGRIGKLVRGFQRFFGDEGAATAGGGAAVSPTTNVGPQMSANNEVNVTVHGSTNPQETAAEVGKQTQAAMDNSLRTAFQQVTTQGEPATP
jgi:hypothetical protein